MWGDGVALPDATINWRWYDALERITIATRNYPNIVHPADAPRVLIVRSDECGPVTSRLLEAVRSADAWLEELGLIQDSMYCLRASFARSYRSDHAVVEITVAPSRSEFIIDVGPGGRDGCAKVSLNAILAVRGLPLIDMRLADQSVDKQLAVIHAGMGGLRQLSATELAGDWSRLDDAQAYLQAAVERNLAEHAGKDPRLNEILRAQSPQRDTAS